jgi:hypothetical protein
VTTLCGNACLLLPWKSKKGCRIRGMISENFYSLYLFVFTPDSGNTVFIELSKVSPKNLYIYIGPRENHRHIRRISCLIQVNKV